MCSENLCFAVDLLDAVHMPGGHTRALKLRLLLEEYISADAPRQLNLPAQLRAAVEQAAAAAAPARIDWELHIEAAAAEFGDDTAVEAFADADGGAGGLSVGAGAGAGLDAGVPSVAAAVGLAIWGGLSVNDPGRWRDGAPPSLSHPVALDVDGCAVINTENTSSATAGAGVVLSCPPLAGLWEGEAWARLRAARQEVGLLLERDQLPSYAGHAPARALGLCLSEAGPAVSEEAAAGAGVHEWGTLSGGSVGAVRPGVFGVAKPRG
jgi:hypothetical protein